MLLNYRAGSASRLSFTFLPALLSLLAAACGARSTLRSGEGDEVVDPPQLCTTDAECASACQVRECRAGECVDVRPVICDDRDPCTDDTCDESLGCVFTPLTPDADGDGHRAALPGFLPGEPGSCGDDCDDTSPLAYPGGFERCDGTDNDCDGVVDNDARYLSTRTIEPLRVASPRTLGASGAGLAYGDGVFALSYGAGSGQWRSYVRGISSRGRSTFSETQLTDVNVSSFGAGLEWSGSSFGAVWPDARQDGNYEIYFARFDSSGQKLGPDLRVTNAKDFSVRPEILYDAGRFVLVWDDRRTAGTSDEARIFGQFVNVDGRLVGSNVELTAAGLVAEAPDVAASQRRLGLVFSLLDPTGAVHLGFRTFDKQLEDASPLVMLGSGDVQGPRITGLRDRFVVSWHTHSAATGYGSSIMAAVLSDTGQILVPPTPVTFDDRLARSHNTLSLGDRLVMVWGEYGGSFDLYAQVLGGSLELLENPTLVTDGAGDELAPYLALSETGILGVLYDSYGADGHQAYFTGLGCPDVLIK